MDNNFIEKLKHVLLQISRKNHEKYLTELIENSELILIEHWNQRNFPNAFNLDIIVNADLFAELYSSVDEIEKIIKKRINSSSHLLIDKAKILPDYNKLQVINSKVFSVLTKWGEINELQSKLISSLKKSDLAVDFQAIGLISRTVMDKIAKHVFDKDKHKPKIDNIDIKNGKFKNQLHTYIDTILMGKDQKEFSKIRY